MNITRALKRTRTRAGRFSGEKLAFSGIFRRGSFDGHCWRRIGINQKRFETCARVPALIKTRRRLGRCFTVNSDGEGNQFNLEE